MHKLFKKAILILAVILVYFLGIKEVRKKVISSQFSSISKVEDRNEFTNIQLNGVSISFFEEDRKENLYRTYKMPFGMFFLFSMILLVLIDGKRNDFLALVLIHFSIGILSYLFIRLSISMNSEWILIPDFLSRYLDPISSMGIVALSYIKQRRDLNES